MLHLDASEKNAIHPMEREIIMSLKRTSHYTPRHNRTTVYHIFSVSVRSTSDVAIPAVCMISRQSQSPSKSLAVYSNDSHGAIRLLWFNIQYMCSLCALCTSVCEMFLVTQRYYYFINAIHIMIPSHFNGIRMCKYSLWTVFWSG